MGILNLNGIAASSLLDFFRLGSSSWSSSRLTDEVLSANGDSPCEALCVASFSVWFDGSALSNIWRIIVLYSELLIRPLRLFSFACSSILSIVGNGPVDGEDA